MIYIIIRNHTFSKVATLDFKKYCMIVRKDTQNYYRFFLFVKICLVTQHVLYFREMSKCCLVECIFCSIWVKYSVAISYDYLT